MTAYLVRVGLEAGINLCLVLPFIALGLLGRPVTKAAVRALSLFTAFFLLDVGAMFSFMVAKWVPFWGGWPWQYKLIDAAWPVLLIALIPTFTAKRLGLQRASRPGSWRALGICCALFVVIAVPLTLWSAHWRLEFSARLPEYLFETILPGLAEEFVYRGVLLSLLNEAFGQPWMFGRTPFGWGGVTIIALFASLHGVDVRSLHSIHVYWVAMLLPGLIGVVLTWLRERSGSVWPAVVFHNVVNLINTLLE